MPILDTSTRDYNGTMRDNTRIRQTGNAGLIQPQEEEQRIADAVLQDRLEVKNTPLSRMTGLKTTVVAKIGNNLVACFFNFCFVSYIERI